MEIGQILSDRVGGRAMLCAMSYLREYPQFFAAVPVYYWPVLCWELFWHRRWCEAELARRGGVDTQIIVSVTWTGRIVVRFIGDDPAPDWQARLSAHASAASRLTASSPFDFIEGPISDAIAAHMKPLLCWHQPLSPIAMNAGPQQPILDPG